MAYRGLERATNLAEPLQDNQSLINLAGPGIDEDISLFVNNLENTSALTFDPSGEGGGIIDSSGGASDRRFLFPRTVPFTFTNGDRVNIEVVNPNTSEVVARNVDGTPEFVEYIVVDFEFGLGEFESQRAFGLATDVGVNPLDLSGIDSMIVRFIRDDSVSQTNLLNIATPEINNSPDNLGVATLGGRNFFSYGVSGDFNSELLRIEENISQANFKRRRKYSVSRSISTDDNIRLRGALRIGDPANALTSDNDLDNPTVPGIFITDPFSPLDSIQKARAFSTLGNPWEEVSSTSSLETPSSQVNIGDLRFEGSLEVDGLGVSDYASISGTDFTHKIPVTVDGVVYFVLLTDS